MLVVEVDVIGAKATQRPLGELRNGNVQAKGLTCTGGQAGYPKIGRVLPHARLSDGCNP
jgi:hypothetical protein